MCIPKPPRPALPPSDVPSMQAASGLQVNAPRGASVLGRLALRIAGVNTQSSASANSASLALSQPAAQASAPRTPQAAGASSPNPLALNPRFDPSALYFGNLDPLGAPP